MAPASSSTPHPLALLGASGFIGAHLVADLGARPGLTVERFSRGRLDLTEPGAARRLAEEIPPGATVVVAAASREPLDTIANLRENTLIGIAVAEAVGLRPPARLVFLSSVEVYGRRGVALPLREGSPLLPATWYGRAKVFTEEVFARACGERGVPLTVLRFPGVYGPGDTSARIVPAILGSARDGRELTVPGDGSQRRDLVHVADIARMITAIISRGIAGTFNAVTGRSLSVNEMIEAAERLCGRRLSRSYRGALPAEYHLDFAPSRFLEAAPGFAFTSFEEGFGLTYASP
jgi:UDP-glucose 4-epimerase